MASNKIARINDDIQFVLSRLLRDIKDPRVQQGMLSVTRVETTGDLRYCKVWVSIEYGAHISQVISGLDIKHDEEEDDEL